MFLLLSFVLEGVWINHNINSKLSFVFEKDLYQSTLILNNKLEAKASGIYSFEENDIYFFPRSYKIKVLNNSYAKKLNDEKFCGLDIWKAQEEVEVINLKCIDQGLDEFGRTKPYTMTSDGENILKLNEQRFIRN